MSKKKHRIVLADDSPQFMEGVELMLVKSSDFTILDKATNGLELINSSELGRADLVITDIEMPIMNGLEAGRKINYQYPRIKLIAVTMYLDKVYLQEVIEAGFKGFIHKPDVAIKLFKVIDMVLRNNFSFDKKLTVRTQK